MCEEYSKQALPNRKYRELLGSAICVFNSNNAFVIESILNADNSSYTWYDLMDKTAGQLDSIVKKTIGEHCDMEVYNLFIDLKTQRNRIVHSFQITNKDGQQVLATKTKAEHGNKQFVITENFLMDFIHKNERLSSLLYNLRDSVK